MRNLVKAVALIAAIVAAFAIIGGSGNDHPGSPRVYEEIAASTDCAWLQEKFDIAGDNHDRARNQSQREWTVAYMKAADDRMHEVGCY